MKTKTAFDLIKTISGLYSLFPRFINPRITRFRWFRELMNRVTTDTKKETYKSKNKVIQLFPEQDQTCYKDLTFREGNLCTIGIDPDFQYIGDIEDKKIDSKETLKEVVKDSINYEKALHLYNTSVDEKIENLENPNVEVVSVYGNFLPTESKIIYNSDPIHRTSMDKPREPDEIKYSYGDGTVITTSAILPPIKWANDFVDKVKHSKPVIFMEICSHARQMTTIFKDKSRYSV